jgi:hypothetical protein
MIYKCNNELATLLELLRNNQKNFFKSQPGSNERFVFLAESKRLEKELDNFLKARKEEEERLPNLLS